MLKGLSLTYPESLSRRNGEEEKEGKEKGGIEEGETRFFPLKI